MNFVDILSKIPEIFQGVLTLFQCNPMMAFARTF